MRLEANNLFPTKEMYFYNISFQKKNIFHEEMYLFYSYLNGSVFVAIIHMNMLLPFMILITARMFLIVE